MTPDILRGQFRNLIASGNLSHAYLFFGKEKEALFSFAMHLAYFLETGSFESQGRMLSDTLVISPDASGSIGIDAARTAKNFLFSRPAVGKRRVVVIAQGEHLTPEAQNALLKIAEEPPEKALLLLTARDAESLLPTVLSRFQRVQIISEGQKKESPKRGDISGARFLKATPAARAVMIKEMLVDDEGKLAAVEELLNELILELHKDLPRSAEAIAFILRRKQLMDQYNVNLRLQLDSISKIL